MKALSLYQPWATFVALGAKTVETRSWGTRHRGPVAICASKNEVELNAERGDYPFRLWREARAIDPRLGDLEVPNERQGGWRFGTVHAVATLVDCFRCGEWWASTDPLMRLVARREEEAGLIPPEGVAIPKVDFVLGDLSAGRFAWVLRDVRALRHPVPVRGKQYLFDLPADVEREVLRATVVPSSAERMDA